ncbi:Alpha/Beta hydrolase protein [Mariannaea sp. PMI_226]|nr:Alpha/Beta hydrolase protein [Mariannaea sp. PMI_226]
MTITFVETDGGKLAVDVAGDGPLVICSPGLGDLRDAYTPLAEALRASGYRVALVDLRGHGDSTPTFNRYGDEATADDLLTLIKTLGGGPTVLMGASLSGAAAVIAAGTQPEQVAGLVLLGPFLRNGAGKFMIWLFHLALSQPWGPSIWRSYAAKLWPGLGDVKAKERAELSTNMLKRPGYWKAFQATAHTDHAVVEPFLSRVKAPVLVVMGDADPDWDDPIAEAKWVASNFTDVETVHVNGAGHAPMFEKPDAVTPAVSRFLDKITAGGAFKSST